MGISREEKIGREKLSVRRAQRSNILRNCNWNKEKVLVLDIGNNILTDLEVRTYTYADAAAKHFNWNTAF